MLVAIITCIAAIASIVLGVREFKQAKSASSERMPLQRSSIAWAIAFFAIQVFIAIWGALGLVQNEPIAPIIMNIVLTGCVYLSVARPRLGRQVVAFLSPEGRWAHPQIATVLAMVVASIFSTLALEIPSNHDIFWMYPLCLLLEVALVTAVVAGVFYLFQRRGAAPAIASFVFFAIGIAEYFVILFKSQPIQPGDLTAIATAAAVGAGYVFELSSYCLYGILFLALAMIVSSYAAVLRPDREHRSRKKFLLNLLIGVLCLGGVIGHVTLIDYYNVLRIQVYTWRPLESYYRQGFIPSFVSSAQTIQPRKPDGYTAELAGGYAEMMENFSDLGLALIVSVGLVYFVLASQFESFVMPVIIMMILPIAFAGALFALPLTGKDLSMISLVSLIMLAGTVVNASIVLVDYIKQRRDRGETREEAILHACPLRIRPVLMTTLTTILALVPTALGMTGKMNEMMSDMGTTMIAGMLVSTVITLLFTPVYYCVIDDLTHRRERRKAKKLAAAQSEP